MDYEMNLNISQKTIETSYPGRVFGSINMSVLNNLQNKLVFLPNQKFVSRTFNECEQKNKNNVFIHATSVYFSFYIGTFFLPLRNGIKDC